MNFKIVLLALVAAAALIGAAIVGVPTTAQKSSQPVHFGLRIG